MAVYQQVDTVSTIDLKHRKKDLMLNLTTKKSRKPQSKSENNSDMSVKSSKSKRHVHFAKR